MTRTLSTIGLLVLAAATAQAEVISFEIRQREPHANGASFGTVGPYEKITGIVRFALDPEHPRNKVIVDLDKAPRNAQGKVEFASDFYILAPKNPDKGNGAILYDVNNRGNKLALGFFNLGPGRQEDGFLFRRGYTVVWSGWIGELLPGGNRLLMQAPIAVDKGKPIRGPVRFEMSTDAPTDSLPLSRREGHGSYPPTKEGEANGVLTWRAHEGDPRVPIPRAQWSLERQPIPQVKDGVPGTLAQIRLKLAGGFRPGYLYELICEAEGPIVQGVGLAGLRDLISFLRNDASPRNPFRKADGKPVLARAHGFGVSQSGRFLRYFMWRGFNEDEAGRKVFDGLMPHVAGGGLGFFNHRFAQPTRHNGQHEDHAYPADFFPFTYGIEREPHTLEEDGILRAYNPKTMPLVMHTQSAAEYWHRSGSLVHTDPLGTKDADIPANVRIYAFGGTQHGPAADPPPQGNADNLANPGDYRPQLRALLDALDAWAKDGKEPPPSLYPRLDKGTLVRPDQKSTGFPSLPGVRYPDVIQQPGFYNYGSRFRKESIIDQEPPQLIGWYVVQVSKSGPDGNDLGTLLPAEVGVPLATYTGWNLRRREVGAEGMLASLLGSYLPFAKTKADRLQNGDPRPSLEDRYGNFDNYRKQFADYCQQLVKQRYLLAEDAERLVANRDKVRDRFAK